MLPQIIFVAIYLLSIGISIGKSDDKFETLIASIIDCAIIFGLLIWGGFFS